MHSILYNQSFLGVGLPPEAYREQVWPYDARIVAEARRLGLLVSFHNCGRGIAILDEMVATGAEALETLTCAEASGDFELGEVRRRVGERITLFGGFNERLLPAATPAAVRAEVERCLAATGGGRRYILRTSGQIVDFTPENMAAFTGR